LGLGRLHAGLHEYGYGDGSRLLWGVAYVFALWLAAYGLGFPDVPVRTAVLRAIGAVGISAVGISLLQLIAGTALLPRFVVFGAGAALLPVYVASAMLSSRARAGAQERDRVVIVADTGDVAAMREDLARSPERHAQIVTAVPPGDIGSLDGARRTLSEVVLEARATVVVLSRAAQTDERIVAQAADLHTSGVRVRTLVRFSEEWLGKLPISELERVSLMFDIGEMHRAYYARIKRIFDVWLGILGLVPLTVVVPFVVVGNLIANRGPLLFRQPRVGKNGEIFEILKFRTMRAAHRSGEGAWTSHNDPRVTAFGRVLRRTHVDELPQVVNIIRGDLSVVGPRPEQPRYVGELGEKIPFYELRHLVRPGLTGWAQVKYDYGSSESDALEKLQYEFYYLRHQNLALDLRVIGRTMRSVVSRGGR
jgi:lipopolysaccharide/colanic/teichoic acid biosynthesis glycosyltransferase